MLEGMQFVYSLSYDGKIFYIGRSQNLIARYASHISTKNNTAVSKFIFALLANGQYPDINIIDFLPRNEADKCEQMFIRGITRGGQSLTNTQCTGWMRHDPKNTPIVRTKKDMIKIITYKQGVYIHQYAQRAIPAPERYEIEYPDNPFGNE